MDTNVVIRGKRWRFRSANIKAMGDCDPPHKRGKEIRIRRSLRGLDLLDTAIHELLHAGSWDLSEEAVEELAHDIAKALIRAGVVTVNDL